MGREGETSDLRLLSLGLAGNAPLPHTFDEHGHMQAVLSSSWSWPWAVNWNWGTALRGNLDLVEFWLGRAWGGAGIGIAHWYRAGKLANSLCLPDEEDTPSPSLPPPNRVDLATVNRKERARKRGHDERTLDRSRRESKSEEIPNRLPCERAPASSSYCTQTQIHSTLTSFPTARLLYDGFLLSPPHQQRPASPERRPPHPLELKSCPSVSFLQTHSWQNDHNWVGWQPP